jgi:hypothetical protein
MPRAESSSVTEKGHIVSNIELRVLRKHAIGGNKRLQRVVPLITAAALCVSLIATAGPASAAVRQPARTAPIRLAFSGNGLPAVSLTTAARYVHLSDGRFTLGTLNAERAGASGQALSTESALVADMNKLLGRGIATVDSARDGVVIDTAKVVPASALDTTITVLPGITLSITSTGIQLSLTAAAVTEVENVASFGENVAGLVGDILALALIPVPYGPGIASSIAGLVANALGIGSDFLRFCTASDGSATFTVPWLGLPSCSGFSL